MAKLSMISIGFASAHTINPDIYETLNLSLHMPLKNRNSSAIFEKLIT